MIIRDGRGVAHDVGPRRVFQFSQIKAIVGYTDNPNGGWTGADHHLIFAKQPRDPDARPVLPLHTFTCESCGRETTRYSLAIYCSDKCRNREAQRRRRTRLGS